MGSLTINKENLGRLVKVSNFSGELAWETKTSTHRAKLAMGKGGWFQEICQDKSTIENHIIIHSCKSNFVSPLGKFKQKKPEGKIPTSSQYQSPKNYHILLVCFRMSPETETP